MIDTEELGRMIIRYSTLEITESGTIYRQGLNQTDIVPLDLHYLGTSR